VQRGEHARAGAGASSASAAPRGARGSPHPSRSMQRAGRDFFSGRPLRPAVNWARPPCTCTLPVQSESVPAQLELVPARSPPGCPLKAGTRGRARAQGATTYALTG
jgi:hypothetical protein